MKAFEFRPKLFTALKNYSKELFMADLMAGIIVGIVALPLAIAFGIASGVSPEKGIITAIIAGFIISMLGGSKVQIGGPTGAFIVIIYGIIQQYGEAGLIVATLMAGIILILLGIVLRISDIIRLLNAVIIVTDSPMTMAGLSCEVTARAEQIPRICIVIGLSFPSGAVRTSLFSVENNLAIFLVN